MGHSLGVRDTHRTWPIGLSCLDLSPGTSGPGRYRHKGTGLQSSRIPAWRSPGPRGLGQILSLSAQLAGLTCRKPPHCVRFLRPWPRAISRADSGGATFPWGAVTPAPQGRLWRVHSFWEVSEEGRSLSWGPRAALGGGGAGTPGQGPPQRRPWNGEGWAGALAQVPKVSVP